MRNVHRPRPPHPRYRAVAVTRQRVDAAFSLPFTRFAAFRRSRSTSFRRCAARVVFCESTRRRSAVSVSRSTRNFTSTTSLLPDAFGCNLRPPCRRGICFSRPKGLCLSHSRRSSPQPILGFGRAQYSSVGFRLRYRKNSWDRLSRSPTQIPSGSTQVTCQQRIAGHSRA